MTERQTQGSINKHSSEWCCITFHEALGKTHLACPSPRLLPKKARPPPGYTAGFCPASLHRFVRQTTLFPPVPVLFVPAEELKTMWHSALTEAYHQIKQVLMKYQRNNKVSRREKQETALQFCPRSKHFDGEQFNMPHTIGEIFFLIKNIKNRV